MMLGWRRKFCLFLSCFHFQTLFSMHVLPWLSNWVAPNLQKKKNQPYEHTVFALFIITCDKVCSDSARTFKLAGHLKDLTYVSSKGPTFISSWHSGAKRNDNVLSVVLNWGCASQEGKKRWKGANRVRDKFTLRHITPSESLGNGERIKNGDLKKTRKEKAHL